MPTFEPVTNPTPEGVLARLDYAAQRASDGTELLAERWNGWLLWQAGVAFPLDLFTKYTEALDYRDAMEAYGSPEDRDFARTTVLNYLTPLTAIVYSHFGLPKKVTA